MDGHASHLPSREADRTVGNQVDTVSAASSPVKRIVLVQRRRKWHLRRPGCNAERGLPMRRARSFEATSSYVCGIAVVCGVALLANAHTAQAGINVWTSRSPYKVSISFRPAELNPQEIDLGRVGKAPRLD